MEVGNVEFLFENNTIAEIEEIERKLKQDVDKKTEELKLIVGEKYRDLIEVSDNILSMRNHCDNIIESISKLSKFRTDLDNLEEGIEPLRYNENLLSNIKYQVITRTPSEIWSCLDRKNVIKALYFYFQSQNLIDISLKEANSKLYQYKHFLHYFERVIVGECWKNLQDCQDDLDELCITNNLLCILVIEKITPERLLERFLECRRLQIQRLLKNSAEVTILLDFFKLLLITCKLVFLIFYDDSNAKSLLTREFAKIPDCHYIQDWLQDPLLATLPLHDLHTFRVDTNGSIQDIDRKLIQNLCFQWIENIKRDSETVFLEKLTHTESISTIFSLCSDIQQYLNESEVLCWDDICDSLLGCKMTIWEHFLRVPVFSALQGLFDESFRCAFKLPLDELLSKGLDRNIINLVWANDVQDNKELSRRATGLPKEITSICSLLDSKLNTLLNGIELMKSEKSIVQLINKADSHQIRNYFVEFLEKHLYLKLSELREIVGGDEISCASEEEEKKNLESTLIVGHLVRGIVLECKSLRHCSEVTPDGEEKYRKMVNELTEFSYKPFLKYLLHQLSKSMQPFEDSLRYSSLADFVYITMAWGEITLEDKAHDGREVKSNIRIPCQVSAPLYNMLYTLSNTANLIAAHALPQQVVIEFLVVFATNINQVYCRVLEDIRNSQKDVPSSAKQTRALQMHFDLKFIERLVNTSKDERLRKNVAQALAKTIKDYETQIDPFDLHVLLPHLQNSLQKALKSCSLVFDFFVIDESIVNARSNTSRSCDPIFSDSSANLTKSLSSNTPNSQKDEFYNLMNIMTLDFNFPLITIKEKHFQ